MQSTNGGEVAHPRALVAPWLLLLLAEAPGHGYQLMDRLRSVGFEWGGPGPIYRELRALEDAGLVVSEWSTPSAGPVPRVYELTEAGLARLDETMAHMDELSNLVRHFRTRHRSLVKGSKGRSGPV